MQTLKLPSGRLIWHLQHGTFNVRERETEGEKTRERERERGNAHGPPQNKTPGWQIGQRNNGI